MKLKEHIPNTFTTFNLGLGVLAIIKSISGYYTTSAILILIAALMDRFDGELARKLNAESELGKQLDSLCDLVSFGVAPAILMWSIDLNRLGIIGILITIYFIATGAYRLARYNTMEFKGIYIGIPITITGSIVGLIALYSIKYHINIYLLGVIISLLSYSMVSTKIRIKKR